MDGKMSKSFFTERPEDAKAVYLTPDHYPIVADGVSDVSDMLQNAISQVKEQYNFGIVFIPEGRYRISKTIYVPKAVRLIGYGAKRPVIILGKNSPGFQTADPTDKGKANYMIWFTDSVPEPGEAVKDANAGTFYSALSNIDLIIEEGNPAAVALRTHFAQHSFIAHSDIHIGSGKAGIFDVGNEIEDVRFFGGDYGIYTTRTSPSWPFLMIDTYFEGQRKAAVLTQEAGLTVMRMHARNVPAVIETTPDYIEKLYMEDCRFEQVSGPAIVISNEGNSHNQISLRNVDCRDVPVLAAFRQSGKLIEGKGEAYKVQLFAHGNQMEDIHVRAEMKTICEMTVLEDLPPLPQSDLPSLPAMTSWVNVKTLGAKGDGKSDDTLAIQSAIEQHRVLYFPQGWYVVSDTLKLKRDTVIIGLNPIAAQLIIGENTPAFAGFGLPKPLLEAPQGGTNILYGIGLDTGARNPRAVGCKWMAGEASYMNDVKFIGGHGSMNPEGGNMPVYNPSRTADADPDRIWDRQYWSLWITNQGGGIFKDIWTASPYASAGLYVSDTSTKSRIYAMSVEHHVRNEVKFKRVSNWRVYALQLEEEVAESSYCLPLELERCSNLFFANTYLFRVIWLNNPYPHAIKTWDCTQIEFMNVHNFTQVKYTIDNTLYDVGSNTEVRPWQLNRLMISGNTPRRGMVSEGSPGKVRKLASGFEFIDALCSDGKGNLYFADSRWKRIYQWNMDQEKLRLITDIPFKPLSLGCDRDGRLLVVVEYYPPKDAAEVYPKPADAEGTAYGKWYNTGSTTKVYAIDPDHPETSMQILEPVAMDSLDQVYKALYPANRWRDNNDYLRITVQKPKECYVAPDGVTIIPISYDLIRASSLAEAYPGAYFYAVDEFYKRTVRFQVSADGYLTEPMIFAEKGEHHVAVDLAGNVYVPDGEIYMYGKDGELIEEIMVPERPACIHLGSYWEKVIFLTARSSLYSVQF